MRQETVPVQEPATAVDPAIIAAAIEAEQAANLARMDARFGPYAEAFRGDDVDYYILYRILRTILPNSLFRAWEAVFAHHTDPELPPFVLYEWIAYDVGRTIRTVEATLRIFVKRQLATIYPDRDNGEWGVRIDFSPLYELAYNYLQWERSGHCIPAKRLFISIMLQQPELVKFLLQFDNYRKVLVQQKRGPKSGSQRKKSFVDQLSYPSIASDEHVLPSVPSEEQAPLPLPSFLSAKPTPPPSTPLHLEKMEMPEQPPTTPLPSEKPVQQESPLQASPVFCEPVPPTPAEKSPQETSTQQEPPATPPTEEQSPNEEPRPQETLSRREAAIRRGFQRSAEIEAKQKAYIAMLTARNKELEEAKKLAATQKQDSSSQSTEDVTQKPAPAMPDNEGAAHQIAKPLVTQNEEGHLMKNNYHQAQRSKRDDEYHTDEVPAITLPPRETLQQGEQLDPRFDNEKSRAAIAKIRQFQAEREKQQQQQQQTKTSTWLSELQRQRQHRRALSERESKMRIFEQSINLWIEKLFPTGKVICYETNWPEGIRKDYYGRTFLTFVGMTYVYTSNEAYRLMQENEMYDFMKEHYEVEPLPEGNAIFTPPGMEFILTEPGTFWWMNPGYERFRPIYSAAIGENAAMFVYPDEEEEAEAEGEE